MQPYHLILSNNDKIVRLGKKRCRYEWPMKSITNTGAAFAVGTDYPVVGLDPFQTIYAAVTRKDADGRISGQNPWEAIDMATVLKGYTYGAAYVYQAEIIEPVRSKKANVQISSCWIRICLRSILRRYRIPKWYGIYLRDRRYMTD